MGTLPSKSLSTLVVDLAGVAGARCFVETGLYRAETTRWAAKRFDEVHSIEIDSRYIEDTAEICAGFGNIEVHHGDSRTCLPGIVDRLTGPTVFWLDAHSGGGHFGPDDDCPLIEELHAIARAQVPTFVFVDDARGFTAPPPPPFDFRAWPDLKSVLDAGYGGGARFSFLHEDVITFIPMEWADIAREMLFGIRPRLTA